MDIILRNEDSRFSVVRDCEIDRTSAKTEEFEQIEVKNELSCFSTVRYSPCRLQLALYQVANSGGNQSNFNGSVNHFIGKQVIPMFQ